MALLTDFLVEVLPYCQNVPEFIATNAVRNAAIEFCQRSHWLTVAITPINLVAGTAAYTLTPPSNTQVVRVQSLSYDQLTLTPKSEEQLRRLYGLDWTQQSGPPAYYTQIDTTAVTFSPTPSANETGAVVGYMVVQPTRTCTTVDQSLFDRWVEVIALGARYRLYETPGQPYSDKTAAVNAYTRFRAGVNDAKAERNRGLTRAAVSVQMPKFT